MIIGKRETLHPQFGCEDFITKFVENNKSEKISTVIWHQDESIICEQVNFSFENKGDIILSELLPSELPVSLSNEKIDFFRKRFLLFPLLNYGQEWKRCNKDLTTIIYLNDELNKSDNSVSVLRDTNLKENNIFKEVRIDYNNLDINNVFEEIHNCKNILINIKRPQMFSSILKFAEKENKIIKHINNHFYFSHRLALLGYFAREPNRMESQSIRHKITSFISTERTILHKSDTLKISLSDEKLYDDLHNVKFRSHLTCDCETKTLQDLIETPIFSRPSRYQINFSLTREQKRLFVMFINNNKHNKEELNSDFVYKCLNKINENSGTIANYFQLISDITSTINNLLPVLSNSALEIGKNHPHVLSQGAYGEALFLCCKLNTPKVPPSTNDIIKQIFQKKYKTINNLFHYHEDFINDKSSANIDLLKCLWNEPIKNKVSFSRLLRIVPTLFEFDDWTSILTRNNTNEQDFNNLVEGYFLNHEICAWMLLWFDDDQFQKIVSEHIENLKVLHNLHSYASPILNLIFIRYDPSFYTSMSKSHQGNLENGVYHLIFNLKTDVSKFSYMESNNNFESSFLYLFLNHFIQILPNKTEVEILKFNTPEDILKNLFNPRHLGHLKFLFSEYDHPLLSKVCSLNESLNPLHKQMDNFITSDRLRKTLKL